MFTTCRIVNRTDIFKFKISATIRFKPYQYSELLNKLRVYDIIFSGQVLHQLYSILVLLFKLTLYVLL